MNNVLNQVLDKKASINSNVLQTSLQRDMNYALLKKPSLDGLSQIDLTPVEKPFLNMDNLKLLIEITRKNLILIFSVSLFSIVLGLWTYFLINPTYKSETTLYVQDKISISEDVSISNIAGLSLGGISALGGSGGVSSRYKTQLLSRKFIINFINKNNLKPYLFAVKSYDKETKQIIFDEKKYDPNKKVWVKSKRNNGKGRPSF